MSAEIWVLAAGACGALAASVGNRAIDRLPYDQSFWQVQPACHVCWRRLGFLEGFPLLGLLSSRVRCSFCRYSARSTRLLVDVLVPILWVVCALSRGPSAAWLLWCLLLTALVVLAVIDFHHFLLPDTITLPLLVLGVAATWLPGWPVSLLESSLSAGIGYLGMMALARAAESYYGQEAIGQGDWKMVALIGAFFGATRLLLIVLCANALGAVVGLGLIATRGEGGRQKLPLGTFLGIAAVVVGLL